MFLIKKFLNRVPKLNLKKQIVRGRLSLIKLLINSRESSCNQPLDENIWTSRTSKDSRHPRRIFFHISERAGNNQLSTGYQKTLSRKMSGTFSKKVDKSTQTDPPQKIYKYRSEEKSKNSLNDKEKVLKEVGLFALKAVGISAAVLGGVTLGVLGLGFTAGGVAAGSVAAAYQSAFLGGTIASGSAFATLQSIGAVGLAASTKAGIIAASAAASGAHSVAKKIKEDKQKEKDSNSKEKEAKREKYYRSQTNTTTGSSKRDASTQTEFDK